MATKSFNDICIEYATQLGKGLPLTPPEMCNAVIMYLNAQITEMQSITTALQTAVAEAEASATEAINKAEDVSETVNALPKVPAPTTSDNGKVIGVQSGVYALVEQSGGEDIPSYTEISGVTYEQGEGAEISYGDNKINLPIIAGDNVIIGADDINRHIKISSVIPDNVVTYNEDGYVYLMATGNNADVLTINAEAIHDSTLVLSPKYLKYIGSNYAMQLVYSHTTNGDFETILPSKSGTIALLDDIPDLDNYTGTVHIVQGTAGSGIAVHDTVKASPYTKYGYDKIETYGNSNSLQYTLNIPNKNGTIATLDDIDSSSRPKLYLHNVTISADNGKIYASAITDFDRDFGSFSEIYDHIGQNVSGYYISGGDYYPIVETFIDATELVHVTVVTNGSQEIFQFDAPEYTDAVKII